MIEIQLTSDERDGLMKEVRGEGGWQGLLRSLQEMGDGDILRVDEGLADRILRYAEYSAGGFQDRLRPIAERLSARRND